MGIALGFDKIIEYKKNVPKNFVNNSVNNSAYNIII
jgi:hypothetical protein